MKGAEAIIRKASFLGCKAVEKIRIEKSYREPQLDRLIREGRTRREARILSKAKEAGVLCPTIYHVGRFSILMKRLDGEMLHHAMKKRKITRKEVRQAAQIVAKLHKANIVHGDFTPANLMLVKGRMAVIDFGLSAISSDIEDKAVDVVTMKRALGKAGKQFVAAYLMENKDNAVVQMAAKIESRARYMERVE
ncbi:MAG: KEOPS complex kinase/ATPase Bud32 [Candidatus Micrarchaeota archaeon]|nr:KEOPS complex kinase/ATPase Bud32 [Candidatus Micrarchaeota archaeon]